MAFMELSRERQRLKRFTAAALEDAKKSQHATDVARKRRCLRVGSAQTNECVNR